ncbi:MAG: hypothetical protein FJ295_06100 [Planctomycetes bacterium]|nr:hypothetical protein [Planctomycetota bacterium]
MSQPAHTNQPSLDATLESTQQMLGRTASRLRLANSFTLIVGVLLVALLAGYFIFGYRQLAEIMEPDTLVAAASTWIEEQLPVARRTVQDEVTRHAPDWAESLSKQAQNSLPDLRGKLEEHVLLQVDEMAEKAMDISEVEFRKFLRDNREPLRKSFEELAVNPQLADESLQLIEEMVDREFQFNMREGADDLFAILNLMTAKLSRLKSGKDLDELEQLERRVLMLARRLQQQNNVLQQ